MRVARWYCPDAHLSFSALPDCMAARLTGSLDQVEEAVVAAESLGVEASAQELRPEVELPGVMRWLRRRRTRVRAALLALITAMPGQLGTLPEVRALRAVLGTERALVRVRAIAADHLAKLPSPLGFWPGPLARPQSERAFQHETGPDPPKK